MSGEGQKLEHIQETINDRDKSLNIELWFGHIFHLFSYQCGRAFCHSIKTIFEPMISNAMLFHLSIYFIFCLISNRFSSFILTISIK